MKNYPVILEDAWKVYLMGKVEVPALRGVNLKVEQGDYTAIEGRSGSGKSTLLNIMGCLDSPTAGDVLIDGINTSRMSENQLARIRRRKIGFVFQTFNLMSGLTAQENVALPMRFDGVSAGVARKKAAELLDVVGLGERIDHKPMELSGGERQRVAIARALINDPELVLADEPTGNLDSKSGKIVIEVLEDLHKTGVTLVVITHDQAVAKRADNSIRLIDGTICHAGKQKCNFKDSH